MALRLIQIISRLLTGRKAIRWRSGQLLANSAPPHNSHNVATFNTHANCFGDDFLGPKISVAKSYTLVIEAFSITSCYRWGSLVRGHQCDSEVQRHSCWQASASTQKTSISCASGSLPSIPDEYLTCDWLLRRNRNATLFAQPQLAPGTLPILDIAWNLPHTLLGYR